MKILLRFGVFMLLTVLMDCSAVMIKSVLRGLFWQMEVVHQL